VQFVFILWFLGLRHYILLLAGISSYRKMDAAVSTEILAFMYKAY